MLRTLCLSALILGGAQAATALTATQQVFEEIVEINLDGTETLKRINADSIIPGDRVVYALSYMNDRIEPASNIVLTMPVPDTINFIDGTASAPSATTLYSVDGGATFGSRESRMVVGENGTMRQAEGSDITHIRWTITQDIQPGIGGELSFAGLLK